MSKWTNIVWQLYSLCVYSFRKRGAEVYTGRMLEC